jgi:putative Mg2+ transporter-C (MgtC) family protein
MWSFLTADWRTLISSPWCEIALVLMSVACGAIVGIERERHERPAGVRTLVLVCLGSTVFTLASYAFTTTTGDSGRVAAQIVTGIGFLGAGVILHSGGSVTGTTTAATVWTMAAIGMTIGAGHAMSGLGLSLLVRFALTGIFWCESHIIDEMQVASVELTFDPDHGKTRIRIAKAMDEFHVRTPVRELDPAPNGDLRLRIDYRLPRRHAHDFLSRFAALDAVHEMREEIAGDERAK